MNAWIIKKYQSHRDKMQFEEILRILKEFKKISGLPVNFKKTNLVAFGKTLAPDLLALKDATHIDIIDNFRLLGIDFNNKFEEEDIEENGKIVIKGMNNNYSQQMEKVRVDLVHYFCSIYQVWPLTVVEIPFLVHQFP